ncbi:MULTISPECIES: MEDS domain-containing protein [Actinokineospora]|uniref:MEDS domain-containing protein n=1 Tax=Actinokineospora fastidiosa TaxID=1816 RepID=A0A918GTD4_9PSEU|nr:MULTISPECIES: MEDS domain-containing protein [Actinokineospora]UVS79292.1 hypothetical protein Actkin_03039 [Actinokineospora sp. UTMC 2448]GGS60220.1 hypothetical protein GCM10010171_64000 [Actinokineospora fastidiosa]
MRAHGVVDSAAGLRPFGHLGWAYRDRADFLARAREYIIDGVAEGQWIEFVGDGDTLRDELVSLSGVPTSDIGVATVAEFYEFAGDVVDPVASVDKQVRAVETAVDAGYTGVRAVVDATAAALTPEQRAAFARFEYLIDQKMSSLPISTVCGYDLGRMDKTATTELVCLHPFTNPGSSLFRIYADGPSEFALSGELDASCVAVFATTLRRTLPLSAARDLRIDGRGLVFIDHRALARLDAVLGEVGATAVLSTSCLVAARLSDIMTLRNLRVDPVGEA